jgi:hypothetical protein
MADEKKVFGIGCGLLILIMLAFACLGGWLFPYTVNSWLEYAGKEPQVKFWMGMIAGFVPGVGQLLIPAALITWMLMLFL